MPPPTVLIVHLRGQKFVLKPATVLRTHKPTVPLQTPANVLVVANLQLQKWQNIDEGGNITTTTFIIQP